MTVYEVNMLTGDSKPAQGYDPFDRCACGHTRRAHLRSYDDGRGQGGCAGWIDVGRSGGGTCGCDEFRPETTETPPEPTLDGKTIGEWRSIALDAQEERRNLDNQLFEVILAFRAFSSRIHDIEKSVTKATDE